MLICPVNPHKMLKMFFLVLCCLLSSSSSLSTKDLPQIPNDGELWVLLVAGSSSWRNYRHQADVCHAYQIVHAHGVPDDHIVVMMSDDLAHNQQNPTPGKIVNRPNGPDVYTGVPKDYTAPHVVPEVFLQVLQGKTMDKSIGSGKTIGSGPNDHVFVYFTDHGAKGLVAFGDVPLRATDLNFAILNMFVNRRYAKMVFYIEACESGSMFKNLLPPDMNVFATTASNATEESAACYWDQTRQTFLGDVYSVKWLEDSDKENIEKETLEEQFNTVKYETNTSQVCQFGDMSISKMSVGNFQGLSSTGSRSAPIKEPHLPTYGPSSPEGPHLPKYVPSSPEEPHLPKYGPSSLEEPHLPKYVPSSPEEPHLPTSGPSSPEEPHLPTYVPSSPEEPHLPTCGRDAVPGPQVPLRILQNKMNEATDDKQAKLAKYKYQKLLKMRQFMENKVRDIVQRITKDHQLTQTILKENIELSEYSCYYSSVDAFRSRCFNLGQNDYALRMLNTFVSLCQRKIESKRIIKAIQAECTHPTISGIH